MTSDPIPRRERQSAPDGAGPALPDGASRRAFLVRSGTAAGATVLGAGVLGAAPAQAGTGRAAAGDAAPDQAGPDQSGRGTPIVAYISDVASGEITVMAGDREVSVTDRQLARALARKVR